jgi:hypothetical protein
MLKQALLITGSTGVSLAGISFARAGEYGTSDEARSMLERAVIEVKSDKVAAFNKFNYNNPAFRDRDLFVFCFDGRDGKLTAHEALVSFDVRKLRDAKGRPFGAEIFKSAERGRVTEVVYSAPVPGTSALADRKAYITRVGDQVCGVSAFEFVAAP